MSSFYKTVALLCLFHICFVSSSEFDVNGEDGWIVPDKSTPLLYNQWASKNRFKVNDIIRFRYKKDSVMVVTEEEYEKCSTSHPSFFSNDGDTIVHLDRPGLFYFISGVTGHCEKDQKMIIKVLETEGPSQSQSQNQTSSYKKKKNDASSLQLPGTAAVTVMFMSMFVFALVL